MKNQAARAGVLTSSLGLSLPPIAAAFPEEAPAGIPAFEGIAPAGCVFWQEAATRTFVTYPKDHRMCAIGVHTHAMAHSPESESDLRDTLQAMAGLDYVREEEVAAIPVLRRAAKHAVYGPLASFPIVPEVVLLFAHARQGLILSEAVARVDRGIPPAMGRPACAIVPLVVNGDRAAMSLGCCGARTYLDALPDSVALWALPGSKLDAYCEQIKVLARANTILATFHEQRGADLASGRRPTVRESLERLST